MNSKASSLIRVGDAAPAPLEPRSETDIFSTWTDGPPVVSILCATYRHVDFIHAAVGGFLAQQTTFPFEIIIRDDASDDGTSEIAQEYASQYPTIITAIIEEHNTYRQKSVLSELQRRAKGEFIALCEGDDYWISPDKLERQVLALRDNAGAVLASHDHITIKGDEVTAARPNPRGRDGVIPARELRMAAHYFHTSTLLYRNVELPSLSGVDATSGGDSYLQARLGLFGDAISVPNIWSVYRRHQGGVFAMIGERQRRVEAIRTIVLTSYTFDLVGDLKARDRSIELAATLLTGPGTPIGYWARIRIGIRMFREAFRHLLRRKPPDF